MPIKNIQAAPGAPGTPESSTFVEVQYDTTAALLKTRTSAGTTATLADTSTAQTLTNKTLTAPTIAAATLSGLVTHNDTITAATSATRRNFYGKVTVTPATTFDVSAGGSLTAIRGEVNVTTGTFRDGFLYGVQGKTVFAGTFDQTSAGRITGVLGQVDCTGATLTEGQVSAVWADIQGDATNTNAETFPLRVTNSASTNVTALAFFYGKSDYLFDVGEPSSVFIATPGGTTIGANPRTLKILVGGVAKYLICADGWS